MQLLSRSLQCHGSYPVSVDHYWAKRLDRFRLRDAHGGFHMAAGLSGVSYEPVVGTSRKPGPEAERVGSRIAYQAHVIACRPLGLPRDEHPLTVVGGIHEVCRSLGTAVNPSQPERYRPVTSGSRRCAASRHQASSTQACSRSTMLARTWVTNHSGNRTSWSWT